MERGGVIERALPMGVLRRTKLCRHWVNSGRCVFANQCGFAHGEAELQPTPDFTKTALCREYKQTGKCSGDDCPFAHGKQEIRTPSYLRFRHHGKGQARRLNNEAQTHHGDGDSNGRSHYSASVDSAPEIPAVTTSLRGSGNLTGPGGVEREAATQLTTEWSSHVMAYDSPPFRSTVCSDQTYAQPDAWPSRSFKHPVPMFANQGNTQVSGIVITPEPQQWPRRGPGPVALAPPQLVRQPFCPTQAPRPNFDAPSRLVHAGHGFMQTNQPPVQHANGDNCDEPPFQYANGNNSGQPPIQYGNGNNCAQMNRTVPGHNMGNVVQDALGQGWHARSTEQANASFAAVGPAPNLSQDSHSTEVPNWLHHYFCMAPNDLEPLLRSVMYQPYFV
eukprot:CAMPEP_0195104210 /NCGR_PEP_ID=MMETSP0448-20130528/72966_1 /TAXON_ID=66468 /ORGANISM="Heterocapsa triquestra, Strain CCMP 448" /LENGTH=388 /DNA_ID=CAMNT_0040140009 /DNA_START=78 /DNA_END=1244 /DNA_ORIENTATION=+